MTDTEINKKLDSIAISLGGICTLFLFFLVFWICLQFAGMDVSEKACFYTKITHVRVKTCLSENRPAADCLAEARAQCLADLVSEDK